MGGDWSKVGDTRMTPSESRSALIPERQDGFSHILLSYLLPWHTLVCIGMMSREGKLIDEHMLCILQYFPSWNYRASTVPIFASVRSCREDLVGGIAIIGLYSFPCAVSKTKTVYCTPALSVVRHVGFQSGRSIILPLTWSRGGGLPLTHCATQPCVCCVVAWRRQNCTRGCEQ
jgi:hypothetical protein